MLMTSCKPDSNVGSQAARPMGGATAFFPTPVEMIETAEVVIGTPRPAVLAAVPTMTETEVPMVSGEVFVGEQVWGEDVEKIERLGQTRFRIVFETGDSLYFIDETGQGIPPEDFDRQRYLRFIDEEGQTYDLPLYLQHDPRWGLQRLGANERFFFGRRGCGQAVAATIASLAGVGIDPLQFSQTYMPDWDGAIGTYPFVYRDIFEGLGLSVRVIKNGWSGIESEALGGHLVVGLVRENFRWWGSRESDNVVDHYVLWYRNEDGEVVIWDPWWGEGVEEADMVEILAAIVIDK